MKTGGKLIIISAALLLLPRIAAAQINNAQYLGDTIPTNMVPGFTYSVSVTMKNTGTTTWTNALQYKLGAVGDSDSFAPGRIALSDSDAIAPGQAKTFEFTMSTPNAGVYTTAWRMLREDVEWFGDTMSKQVVVAFGPDSPGAPTIHSPLRGMNMGSNRPDIRFQGDPCDAYEVHIGSCDLTTSTDGWDSGVVSSNSGPNELLAAPGVLNPQSTYYVFARLHNTHGWGPWSASGNWFYTAGQLVNDPYLVSGNAGFQRAHNLCYNPDRNEYLVCYWNNTVPDRHSEVSYYRLDGTGAMIGAEMWIPDDMAGCFDYNEEKGPCPCYNSARHEYLIAYAGYYYDNRIAVRTQRVDAVTGALVGGSDIIAWDHYCPRVAYSPTSDHYLVVWDGVDGLILDSTAAPVGTSFHLSDNTLQGPWNSAITYNSVDNEFLVVFQATTDATTWYDMFAQRVRASDGTLLGGNIVVARTVDWDWEGDVTYDSNMNRYLVTYASSGSPSPWLQFVGASGVLQGYRFPASTNTYYDGGLPGISWNPVTREYLATWAHGASQANFAQRISEDGAYVGETFRTNGYVMGEGNWDPVAAVNTSNGEYLICWFWQYARVYVRRYQSYPLPPVDVVPPGPVMSLALSRSPTGMSLSWINPSSADFSATMVRWKIGSPPSDPADGRLVVDQANCPGSADTLLDAAAPRGLLYCYALFAHDVVSNYAPAATACGTLVGGDFNGDDDVDQNDFGHLQACLTGPGVPPAAGCADADLDIDGDVDALDLSAFRACMNGSGRGPGC